MDDAALWTWLVENTDDMSLPQRIVLAEQNGPYDIVDGLTKS